LDTDPYSDERNLSRLKDLAERLLDYDYHVEGGKQKPLQKQRVIFVSRPGLEPGT
jgi:hypothetical protein